MNLPNTKLMRAYGTFATFQEKTANVQPIASRIGELAMGQAILGQMTRAHTARQTMQAQLMNTMFRVLELSKMEQAIDNANHTVAPMILPQGYDLPVGMDEGMIRIASAIGQNMAKEAALPGQTDMFQKALDRTGLSGGKYKWKLPALALGAAGTLGALHVAKKGLGILGQEVPSRTYGTGGNMLAPNVNEYGTPQPVVPHY